MRPVRHVIARRTWAPALILTLPTLLGAIALEATPAHAQTSSTPSLAACLIPDSIGNQLRRIARRVGGNAGISAIHLESGARISLNGERSFPMASVSKVPMALEFLRRVDAGEIDVRETLVVPPTDFRPGSSPIARRSGGRAVRVSVDSLFRLMIGVSDNTATDVILRMSGGPEAATRRVRELGVQGVRVDRSEARTFADLVGISESVPESDLHRYSYFRLRNALSRERRDAARERYGEDPQDTATPDGMASLLAHLYFGAGLSEESRAQLLDTMTGTRTGARRLKGLLPTDTPVAHKTGTMAGAINDVGIITLPNGGGHLVVAAFVNTLDVRTRSRERTIAEMTRLLYDYFTEDAPPTITGRMAAACSTGAGAAGAGP
jgi:beta-lactamase class A